MSFVFEVMPWKGEGQVITSKKRSDCAKIVASGWITAITTEITEIPRFYRNYLITKEITVITDGMAKWITVITREITEIPRKLS